MNNLSSYCGLTDSKMRTSDTGLQEIHENRYLYFPHKMSLFLEQILPTLHWKLKSLCVLIRSMLHFTSGKLEKLICRTLLAFLASQSTNLAVTCYAKTTFIVITRRGTTYYSWKVKYQNDLDPCPSETLNAYFFLYEHNQGRSVSANSLPL